MNCTSESTIVARIEEWNDLLEKYRLGLKGEHVHYSINMETFNGVLEEFDINKALITLVPDPIYEVSEANMLEFGSETAVRLCPDGTWILDSSHAIFCIFQAVVWGVNWKNIECSVHESCNTEMRRVIIEVMRQYQNIPVGKFIPIVFIQKTIEWLRSLCFWNLRSKGSDVTSAISKIDTTPHAQSMLYQVYQQAVSFYELPNYDKILNLTGNASSDSHTDVIPVWMTRALLLAGWAQRFFDKETVDLADVILELIFKKVPVKSKDVIVSLMKTVQASISGLHFTHPSDTQRLLNDTGNREGAASESHQKMLRKAQERNEKLRKRKELSKSGKVKNPSSTNAVKPIGETSEELRITEEFVRGSFLEKQEYPESRLIVTGINVDNRVTVTRKAMTLRYTPYHKEREFGNAPNVFSLLDNAAEKGASGSGALETSFSEELVKEEAVMKDDVDQILKVDENLKTIIEFKIEEQEVVELEEQEELVKEEAIILAEDEDRCTIDEFQKEEEEELEVEDVKTLDIEVERLKENAEDLKAQTANESENQLKEMIVELEFLKKRLDDAENVIEEKESEIKNFKEKFKLLAELLDEKKKSIAMLEKHLTSYKEAAKNMLEKTKDLFKENKDLSLKLMTLEEQRDSDIKYMVEEKQLLIGLLDEKTRKVDDVEKKTKLKDLEMNQMRAELKELKGLKKQADLDTKRIEEEKKKLMCSLDEKSREVDVVGKQMRLKDSEMDRLRKQSEGQEKLLEKKETVIERFKVEAEISKSRIYEKDAEIVRLNNELSKSTETNESLVFQLSRLEEEIRKSKIEDQEKNESFQNEILKKNEEFQTANRRLSILNEEQERRVQNLLDRLAMTHPPAVSTQEVKPESVQSQFSAIKNLCDRFINSADSEELKQFRITLQRLRNIKDRFQNKDQLKLARTMTDKLITMSNRSEIRELALYEYQQYEANFQNYTQLVDLNIEKMKETRDCSLYSPLPKPPAFSDRFMNEYWLQCDKKKELEMDISDSECLICFFEMNSDQKTLKCDHCNKITHLKCASKWLQIHRSCPHCRREQLDPDEFPALS
ncbi:hypothetical protein B9Z55_009102 [Caenorhabditis nigoni]|uniref:RING-type domain-containing protein n=1 Tax=Caenorhabditis nigoni TaxID=1611254 RepID=A0A2G5UQK4_9PELO|nr:hypothetical protein B9Z55_009102 [Caenorhabditis nigoni]